MVRRVSDLQLAEMKENGEVKYDPEGREIARFGELLETLEKMIAANTVRTSADMDRSQVQLEILGTLQKMIRANGTKSQSPGATIDLQPLNDLLATLVEKSHTHGLVAYDFEFVRDQNGFTRKIIATPIEVKPRLD